MSKPVEAIEAGGIAVLGDLIQRLDTPEKCAEFYIAAQPAYRAVIEAWTHVRSVLMVEGQKRSFKTESGKVVTLEPSRYEYDIDTIDSIAPEVITEESAAQSPEMETINRLAGEMLAAAIDMEPDWVSGYAEEILRLSQPKIVRKVNGQKLSGILGRGDQKAQALANKQVKVPVEYKIVVK